MAVPDAVPLGPGDFDPDILTRYLRDASPELDGEIEYARFTAGHSNLTYLVRANGRDYVLKRQPPGPAAGSAHDMGREFGMLSGLAGAYAKAPRALLLCKDPAVIGGDFLVMQRIDGLIVRSGSAGLDLDTRRAQLLALVEGLAELHRAGLDLRAFGGLGRPEGYRRRQAQGWRKRYQAARFPGMAEGDDVADWLCSHVPDTREGATVVHNDFKLDNLVWDASQPARLKGVLDWEMSTLGDPLMDLACTLSFWTEAGDPPAFRAIRSMPSDHPALPGRAEAKALYARLTGADLTAFGFHMAYAFFRRAVIEEQKHNRFLEGRSQDPRYADLGGDVAVLLQMSRAAIEG